MVNGGSRSSGSEDLIALGVIRKPHGIRGEASIESWTNTPDRFEEVSDVLLVSPDGGESRPVRILSSRPHSDRVLLMFEGISSPEEIRSLRDWTIEVPISQARSLEENEYFLHDLIGLQAVERSGQLIGEVTETNVGGGGILLTISRPTGTSFELPFAAEICHTIDLEANRLIVDLPEGITDLQVSDDEVTPAPSAPQGSLSVDQARTCSFRFDVVTIFPSMFEAILSEGVIARAVSNGTLQINVWDLREFTADRHRSTDDEAYGGGAGMVMLADPIFRCVENIREAADDSGDQPTVVMLSPQGDRFDQASARRLAGQGWLILLCGRYEGFDERVRSLVDLELSVGDFVVSGGELPAMLVVDAVSRLIDGVVGDRNSVEADSFYNGLLDYPHYTRPAEYRGLAVPDVLLSGHFENIRRWRKEQSLRVTLQKRPELLDRTDLDEEAKKMLEKLGWTKSSDVGTKLP